MNDQLKNPEEVPTETTEETEKQDHSQWPFKLTQSTMFSMAFATLFAIVVVIAYNHTAKAPNPIKRILLKQEEILSRSDSVDENLVVVLHNSETTLSVVREIAAQMHSAPVNQSTNAPLSEQCKWEVNGMLLVLTEHFAQDNHLVNMGRFIAEVLLYIDDLESPGTDVTPGAMAKFLSIHKDDENANKQAAIALRKLLRAGLDAENIDALIRAVGANAELTNKAQTIKSQILHIDTINKEIGAKLAALRSVCGISDEATSAPHD